MVLKNLKDKYLIFLTKPFVGLKLKSGKTKSLEVNFDSNFILWSNGLRSLKLQLEKVVCYKLRGGSPASSVPPPADPLQNNGIL